MIIRMLMLIILISNVIALILALISMYLTNRTFKEYERRLRKIYKICEDNIYEDIDDLQMMYILADISSICSRGVRIYK